MLRNFWQARADSYVETTLKHCLNEQNTPFYGQSIKKKSYHNGIMSLYLLDHVEKYYMIVCVFMSAFMQYMGIKSLVDAKN
jgi:hypothetical protein